VLEQQTVVMVVLVQQMLEQVSLVLLAAQE
jgi:hypothetical protein